MNIDQEVEKTVLGAFLRNPELIDGENPTNFFSPRNRALFTGILSLIERKSPVDPVLLSHESGVPIHQILEIEDNFPIDGINLDHYRNLLKTESRRRSLQDFLERSLKEIKETSDSFPEIEGKISQGILNLISSSGDHRNRTTETVLKEVIEGYFSQKVEREAGRRTFGIPTGFRTLDDTLGGLQAGTLGIIAGRLGHGKSTVGMDVFLNAVRNETPALYVSLEQPSCENLLHLIQKETGFDPLKIKTGDLSEQQEITLTGEIYKRFKGYPLHLDDRSRTLNDLTLRVRRMALAYKVRLVVVDYLQLIENFIKGEPRHIQVAGISRGLKRLAMNLGLSLVGLAQLNRNPEERESKRISLADIRESDSIAQDADWVLFVHRPRLMGKDDTDHLELAKNRYGKTVSRINVRYDESRNTYREIQSDESRLFG